MSKDNALKVLAVSSQLCMVEMLCLGRCMRFAAKQSALVGCFRLALASSRLARHHAHADMDLHHAINAS